jgi:Ca-activated chloride channel family protein
MAVWITGLAAFTTAHADIGILLPGDSDEPEPEKLTLEEARIQIRIDHQYARVKIIQIFGNRTSGVLEGKYVFAIPGDAAISDFAVWDGAVRIPGVILERKRASELYQEIKMQQIDPGLLQQEEGAEGSRMASAFSARIVPIPAFATKRLEIEYTQKVAVDGLGSYFALPLKPDLFRSQQIGHRSLSLEVLSDATLADFQILSRDYPVRYDSLTPKKVQASFEANQIQLNDDFSFRYRIASQNTELYFLPYRGSEKSLRKEGSPITAEEKPSSTGLEDGYFWTSAIWNEKLASVSGDPRSVLILLDISASMHWEKLEQSYRALEYFLKQLTEKDEFQLIVYHQETKVNNPVPLAATSGNVSSALQFVKSQYLMGGTDLEKAMGHAFSSAALLKNPQRYLVWITDGNPTLTELQSRKLIEKFEQENQKAKLRAFCFGIGSDSNRNLLTSFAEKSRGHFDWVRETEDLSFKLERFFSKIGQYPISKIQLTSSEPDLLYQVYPSGPASAYDGSSIDWFGRYKHPAKGVSLKVSASAEGKEANAERKVDFPEEDTEHNFIPRGWARMRVDALLRKIELEGEDTASIDEIIALAKKYKFVTPYTSFLAAPRSLLRPRVIRPGDPLLRVRTDPEIRSVVAIFPFGLIKSLEYLKEEDIWQTRFLVPKTMSDGNYSCRLILSDRSGNQYQEKKTILIDGKPPVFQVRYQGDFLRGHSIKILVAADRDTRTIYAGLDMLRPVPLHWSSTDQASVGYIQIPADVLPGTYELQINGEDFAHNTSRWARKVEVY